MVFISGRSNGSCCTNDACVRNRINNHVSLVKTGLPGDHTLLTGGGTRCTQTEATGGPVVQLMKGVGMQTCRCWDSVWSFIIKNFLKEAQN